MVKSLLLIKLNCLRIKINKWIVKIQKVDLVSVQIETTNQIERIKHTRATIWIYMEQKINMLQTLRPALTTT